MIMIFILANPCNRHITWWIPLPKVNRSNISHIGQVQWCHQGNSILSMFWFLTWTALCIVIIVKSWTFVAMWSMAWVKRSFWLEMRPGVSQNGGFGSKPRISYKTRKVYDFFITFYKYFVLLGQYNYACSNTSFQWISLWQL